MRRLAALLPLWLSAAACSGLFQKQQPAVPAEFARTTAVTTLAVGSAERDITPAVGGFLAGFDPARRSTAVDLPLKVRVLVLLAGERRLAIVGIDNLGLMREDVDWLKAGLPGFANGDVFVCSSHTHAGPDLIGLWGPYLWTSGRDRDYLAAVRAATAAAIAEAVAIAAPARLVRATARLPARGLVKNANCPGVFDRRLQVLQARASADDRPLGTLLHLACHPEVLPRRNTAISADFVGALCDGWRQRGQGQAVFLNGALGAMISPDVQPRDAQGIAAFGRTAVDLALAALAAAEPLPVAAIEVRRRDVYVPVRTLGFRLGRLTLALPRELHDGAVRSTVGYLRLGAFAAVAVPGEMEPALAEQLRAELGQPDLLVFGLCDDELGYLLRLQEARDPEYAYERSMSPCLHAGELVRWAVTGRP